MKSLKTFNGALISKQPDKTLNRRNIFNDTTMVVFILAE